MYTFKVKELKDIKSRKKGETKMAYKMAAINENTKEKIRLESEEPIKFREGQEIKLEGDKSQRKLA